MQVAAVGIDVNVGMIPLGAVGMAVRVLMGPRHSVCRTGVGATANYTHVVVSFLVMSIIFHQHVDHTQLGAASGL
jgi:hypothetical protein